MSTDNAHTVETLYRDHNRWLRGWLTKKLNCSDTAEDLTHDTFIRIIKSDSLPRIDQSRSFLIKVAKNLAIDLHRRKILERTYLETLATLPKPQYPSAEERAEIIETLCQIDEMLDQMPAKVREAFLLSRFECLTYSEIAKKMNISFSTVRNYLLKASIECSLTLSTKRL